MNQAHVLPPRSIRAAGLSVRRGARVLFSDVGFDIAPGGVLLVRGPNGVGKSSLLLTLSGAIRPEAGTIDVVGRDPDAAPGVDLHLVGHGAAVKPQLTVVENLTFWRDLFGGAGEARTALAAVGLEATADLPAGYLSAGQTRRLALARLLVASRPIWLLDEPTSSLDRAGEALVTHLIDRHAAAGGIAVAATHHDLPLAAPAATLDLGPPA